MPLKECIFKDAASPLKPAWLRFFTLTYTCRVKLHYVTSLLVPSMWDFIKHGMSNSSHYKRKGKFADNLSFAGIQNGNNLVSAISAIGTDKAKSWTDAES